MRNWPHYSEDEDFFNQPFHNNPQNNSWKTDQTDPFYQPDIFELYTRSKQTRQSRQPFPPKQISASYNNDFQPQFPMTTQNYQINQKQNEI